LALVIRPVTEGDRTTWLDLWAQYCAFYGVTLSQQVIVRTWQRIVSPHDSIFSLIAKDESGTAVGLCNYVCHPNTWSDRTVCYLEDLYVSPDARRLGVGTKLIGELTEIGRREHWFRIYWITNANNEQARAAYDKLAMRTDHVRYEISL